MLRTEISYLLFAPVSHFIPKTMHISICPPPNRILKTFIRHTFFEWKTDILHADPSHETLCSTLLVFYPYIKLQWKQIYCILRKYYVKQYLMGWNSLLAFSWVFLFGVILFSCGCCCCFGMQELGRCQSNASWKKKEKKQIARMYATMPKTVKSFRTQLFGVCPFFPFEATSWFSKGCEDQIKWTRLVFLFYVHI